MDLEALRPENRRGLLPIEAVTLAYTLLTSAIIAVCWTEMDHPLRLVEGRAMVVLGMAATWAIYRAAPSRATRFLRSLYPLTLLGFWYPDTYEFCQLLPNLDWLFAEADLRLFGCQPSLMMKLWLPSRAWSEAFHLGYFAYYPMILLTVMLPLLTGRREAFERTAFTVLACFFFYYAIYLFLPVAGPQYYFHAVSPDLVGQGCFPHLGDYFRHHTELRPSALPDGLFKRLVEATQQSGERPTAAFPSSHVGMSTVMMILCRRLHRPTFRALIPFYALLCGATVYIEAHYLVDVLGGWLTALLFVPAAEALYARLGARTAATPGAAPH